MALLTKKELADRLRVATRTIDRMRSAGYDLGEIRLPGGHVRFRTEPVDEIIRTAKFRRVNH